MRLVSFSGVSLLSLPSRCTPLRKAPAQDRWTSPSRVCYTDGMTTEIRTQDQTIRVNRDGSVSRCQGAVSFEPAPPITVSRNR